MENGEKTAKSSWSGQLLQTGLQQRRGLHRALLQMPKIQTIRTEQAQDGSGTRGGAQHVGTQLRGGADTRSDKMRRHMGILGVHGNEQ